MYYVTVAFHVRVPYVCMSLNFYIILFGLNGVHYFFTAPSNPPVAPSPVWQDTSSTSAAGAGQERVLHETIQVHQPQFIGKFLFHIAKYKEITHSTMRWNIMARLLHDYSRYFIFTESQNAAVPVPIQPTTQYDHHLTRQVPVWSIDIPLVDGKLLMPTFMSFATKYVILIIY